MDDDGSRLSLEYSGSQSPMPPSPVLPKGHRYFGHAGAHMQPVEDAALPGKPVVLPVEGCSKACCCAPLTSSLSSTG
jgi:hypothetical protein